jgi:hypothetical protein
MIEIFLLRDHARGVVCLAADSIPLRIAMVSTIITQKATSEYWHSDTIALKSEWFIVSR